MVKENSMAIVALGIGAYLLLKNNQQDQNLEYKPTYGATGSIESGTTTPQTFYSSPPPSQTSGGSANTPAQSKAVTFKTVTEGVNALNEAWKSGQKIQTSGGVIWSNPTNKNDKILQLSTGDIKRVTVRTVK